MWHKSSFDLRRMIRQRNRRVRIQLDAIAKLKHRCKMFERKVNEASAIALEAENKVAQLEELLKDVPGDSIEQKIQRMFHELEQAHERIAQFKTENERLQPLAEYGLGAYQNIRLMFLDDAVDVRKRVEALRGEE